jgi:hypothetical protein
VSASTGSTIAAATMPPTPATATIRFVPRFVIG